MSANPIEIRITELETRLEFQDETITKLNDELVVHQRRVFLLDKKLKLLIAHIQGNNEDATLLDPKDEPAPPHY